MIDFSVKKRIEKQYKANLNGLFKHLYDFILTGDVEKVIASKAFSSFCNSVASRMITGLAVENAKDWRAAAREGQQGRMIYEALRNEMQGPIGYKLQSLVDDNAKLIKSVSQSFATTITNQIKENAQSGVRASVYAEKLKEWSETNGVDKLTEARCNLIARTETSKASTALTQARAQNLGLNWYIWRTSEDFRVRSSHKLMDEVLISWSDPPSPEQLDNIKSSLGHYHAGNCPNCRCYPEPIVNLSLVKFPAKVYTGGKIVTMARVEFERLNSITQKDNIRWTNNKQDNIKTFTKILKEEGVSVEVAPKGRLLNTHIAAKLDGTNILHINENAEWFKNPVAYQEHYNNINHFSTSNPVGFAKHEAAHFKFKYVENKLLTEMQVELISKEVSNYAATDINEFIAEVYAGIETGKNYSEEIMTLFKQHAKKG